MEKVAGVQSEAGIDTALACLTMEERPTTPPAIRRWRKSHNSEPGMRVVHPGLQQDVLPDDDRAFGNGRASASDHVADVWKHPGTETEFAAKKLADSEKVYRSRAREPLGRSYRRGHDLPPIAAFGVSTVTQKECGDDAKQLVQQPSIVDDDRAKVLYAKSHGYQDPGMQTRRGYSWKKDLDPSTYRFGIGSGSHLAMNGASRGAADALRDDVDGSRSLDASNVQSVSLAALSTNRELGRRSSRLCAIDDDQRVFGKATTARGEEAWDARKCITGDGENLVQGDDDLGKTLTPGFRNTDTTRIFGVPSIRSEVSTTRRASISDTNNYGDTASTLLCPPAIKGQAFAQRRTKSENWDIIRAVRPDLDRDTFDELHSSLVDSTGRASLKDLHYALLRYPRPRS